MTFVAFALTLLAIFLHSRCRHYERELRRIALMYPHSTNIQVVAMKIAPEDRPQ